MTEKPPPRKRTTKSAAMHSNEVKLESRLTRIETQLDILIDRLKALPQSPQCIEGISELNKKLSILDERLTTHMAEDDWREKEHNKIDQRLKNIETRTTYWMGSIAVMTPIALLSLKAIADTLFK